MLRMVSAGIIGLGYCMRVSVILCLPILYRPGLPDVIFIWKIHEWLQLQKLIRWLQKTYIIFVS
jgi:hypothetical protein